MPEPLAVYSCRIEAHQAGEIPLWLFRRPGGGGADPLVIVLHGLTSRKERHLEWCLELAAAGMTACAFDLRSHGARRDDDSPALQGDQTTPEFAAAFARVTVGTVQDIIRVAEYLGAEHWGLLGHSFGGYIALQTALVEPRAVAIANVSGSINAAGTIGDIELPDIPANAARLGRRPVLLVHGDADTIVPVAGARKFRDAFIQEYGADAKRVQYREYPGVGHELLPEMRHEATLFLRHALGGIHEP